MTIFSEILIALSLFEIPTTYFVFQNPLFSGSFDYYFNYSVLISNSNYLTFLKYYLIPIFIK